MSFEQEPSFELIQRSEAVVRLGSVIVQKYRAVMGIDDASLMTSVNKFCPWVADQGSLWTPDEIGTLCKQANVGREIWDLLYELCNNPDGPALLGPAWPEIVLDFRGTPKHKLASVVTCIVLKWEDGKVWPIVGHVPAVVAKDATLSDGSVCTVLPRISAQMISNLATEGLDTVYAKAWMADDEAYEIMMGAFLKQIEVSDAILKERLTGVLRAFQAMFRPPLPEAVRRQLAQMEAQRQAAQPTVPEGGFD